MKFLRSLGVAALLLLAALGINQAATVATFTGPAGTNPAQLAVIPGGLSDMNTLVNSINSNAAFAGNTAPSGVLGTQLTSSSSKFSNTAQPILQFMNASTFTTTTNTVGGCMIALATVCFGVLDPNGFIRWIPAS